MPNELKESAPTQNQIFSQNSHLGSETKIYAKRLRAKTIKSRNWSLISGLIHSKTAPPLGDNWYSYVNGDPINNSDPSGYSPGQARGVPNPTSPGSFNDYPGWNSKSKPSTVQVCYRITSGTPHKYIRIPGQAGYGFEPGTNMSKIEFLAGRETSGIVLNELSTPRVICSDVKIPKCCNSSNFISKVNQLANQSRSSPPKYCGLDYNCITWANEIIAKAKSDACGK